MARIRTIKPDFMASNSVGRLSLEARLFFLQLLTQLDDEGRARFSAKMLAGVLYPYDDQIKASHIVEWIEECEAQDNMLVRYEVDGVTYLAAPQFCRHQSINKANQSNCPPPPVASKGPARVPKNGKNTVSNTSAGSLRDDYRNDTVALPDDSRSTPVALPGGMEGNGKEWKGGVEGRGTDEQAHPKKTISGKFVKPTEAQCVAEAVRLGMPEAEGSKFWHYQESKGWVVGKAPMKDAKAAIRTWYLNWRDQRPPSSPNPPGSPPPKTDHPEFPPECEVR